jgi:transcriptional regulator with XRE-family HTH domain
MSMSEQIKTVRNNLKETQAAFAARFGLDQATISRWENKGIPERGPARMAVERLLADLRRKRKRAA